MRLSDLLLLEFPLMKAQRSLLVGWLAGAAMLAGITTPAPLARQERKPDQAKSQTTAAETPHAWTLDEAMSQLKIYPKDGYLQYVALQLARRLNRMDEISPEI